MKRKASAFTAAALVLSLSCCSVREKAPPQLADITETVSGKYTCTFDGVKHDFIVDLPDVTENAPLVVMLHGYGDSAESFRTSTGFHKRANAEGYAVAYVTGACDPDDPASSAGWNSYSDGTGNRDVEFLTALADHLQEQYALDSSRTFAVGFSNGGFMTHRLAMEASDTYAAVVSVSGMMQESVWKKRRSANNVGVFQLTGEKDDAVPKNSDGTAEHTKAPAIEDVMAYWAESNGLALSGTIGTGKGSLLRKYTGGDDSRQVWDIVIKDGRHSWCWEQNSVNGIDTTELILEFLETE